MSNELPWRERVHMLSIHPMAARPQDVERMATELMEAWIWTERAKVLLQKTTDFVASYLRERGVDPETGRKG